MAGNIASGVRRVVRDVVLAVVAVACLLGGYTVMGSHGVTLDTPKVVDRGIAVARSCEFGGPFGYGEPGWWWACQADVRWDARGPERVEFTSSQLTESDIGREVPVVLHEITNGAGKGTYHVPYRADFEPQPLLGAVLAAPLLLVGFVIVGLFLGRIAKAVKRVRSVER
ncbi:DUF6346 domain-containing protein [Saccharopolyspora hordei]|uniref:Uncharacterized protein n=1 Tax=Saccharopolyspora hordei TaxID=1838 RepID=A0A853AKQ1_9PSEU|nr:DUF6346 domain-containing protein [Saccharopolyspora hordei]NYI82823.1 hypothetical protein [Saccharopolyspora hordei]